MIEVYNSVCAWNAARYDREYSKKLTLELLREEYNEYLEAGSNEVEQLDALCDIMYVAMGALWKLDAPASTNEVCFESAIELVTNMIALNEVNPIYFVSTFLDVYEYASYPAAQVLHNILTATQTQINGMGVNPVEAMKVVCASNDTKVAGKTASDIKANLNKGDSYVPPTAGLTALLEARHA